MKSALIPKSVLLLMLAFSSTALSQSAQPLINTPLPGAQLADSSPVVQPPHSAPAPAVRPFSLADFKAQVAMTSDGHFLLTVPQICNTVGDPQVRDILAGRSVQAIAEVEAPSQNQPAWPHLRVSRKLISCCSSHARTYTLLTDCARIVPPSKFPAWARITGTIVYQRKGLELVPTLQATKFEEVPAPLTPILN